MPCSRTAGAPRTSSIPRAWRRAAQRALVDGELRATQARVDPDALFETLQDIDRAYARSTAAGEAALDTLIASLRQRFA
jgi:hypothetical protein